MAEVKDGNFGDMISRSFQTQTYVPIFNSWFLNPRITTLIWVYFVLFYWTIIVMVPCIAYNDLKRYEFYVWIFGMIGVCSVYYAVKGGYPADSPGGKPVIAFTATVISVDCAIDAYKILTDNYTGTLSQRAHFAIMMLHTITLLWTTLFFYNRAVVNKKNLAWLSLLVEWFDLIFMVIAIYVIHHILGECFHSALCIGYFVVLTLNLVLWFFPIMLGYSDTERSIHIHIVVLDMCTDFPLVVTIILTQAYTISWFIFFDVIYKLIVLLRSITYHGVLNLFLRREELRLLERHQKEQIELENRLMDEGKNVDEISIQVNDLQIKQQQSLQVRLSQH